MGVKLAVRTRIVVNKKEYHGVDEMPPEVRTVYEKVMHFGAQAGAPPAPGQSVSAIVFNGQPYESPEAMPPEVRRLYEAALASLPKGNLPESALPREAPDSAIEPEGGSRWTIAAFLGGVGLLILWYLLR